MNRKIRTLKTNVQRTKLSNAIMGTTTCHSGTRRSDERTAKYLRSQNRINTIVTVVPAITILMILIQDSFIISAQAMTQYFNCVTRVANNNGTLTLENVEGWYAKVFQGTRDANRDGNKLR